MTNQLKTSCYYIRNLMLHTFYTLKESERYMQENSSRSNYEAFWDQLNHGFSLSNRAYRPSHSTVEAFYRGTLSFDNFLMEIEQNIIQKAQDKLDDNMDPLLTISWDVYRSNHRRAELCERLPRLCGRQLWAIYNKLDVESTGLVHIEDITQVILKIFIAHGKNEDPNNIYEWFCEQKSVDFWSFFSALVENHSYLLQAPVIQSLYEEIVHEVLKQGKMTKKGHTVQSWKDRWFVLTANNLSYYESLENRTLKGTIVINRFTRVDNLPDTKGRSYLFRVTDGSTGRIYDISASDPQVLQDWIEILKVLVAAQTENGRHLLHKMSLAKAKLFPSSIVKISHVPFQPVEYNEGVYRVVSPRKLPVNNKTSGSSIESLPSPIKSPSNESSSISNATTEPPPTSAKTFSQEKSPNGVAIRSPPKSNGNGQKTKPPPVTPYIQHVNNTNYASIDQVMADTSSPSHGPPQQPQTSQTQNVKHTQKDGYDYALVDKVMEEAFSESLQSPTVKSFDNSSESQQQQQLSSSYSGPGPAASKPRPTPKPRTMKPKIIETGGSGSYAELAFVQTTPTDDPETKLTPTGPTRSYAAKAKFAYSQVLLTETTVTQDIDRAQELKANRQPPAMPSKYSPNKKDANKAYNSDSSIMLTSSTSSSDSSANFSNHYYQNVHYNTSPTPPSNGDDNAPPVPRRMQSNRTSPAELSNSAPIPPPRTPQSLAPPR